MFAPGGTLALAGPGSHERFSAWFRPDQRRAAENTDANRNRVHEKIAKARMSTGNRQLSNLDTSAKYHGHNARQPLVAAVGDPEGDPVQKKYAGVLDLMGQKCARPDAGRNQRQNNNGRQSEPRRCAAEGSYHHAIPISIVRRGSACKTRITLSCRRRIPVGVAQVPAMPRQKGQDRRLVSVNGKSTAAGAGRGHHPGNQRVISWSPRPSRVAEMIYPMAVGSIAAAGRPRLFEWRHGS
jgi:hypothetical protein